MIKTKIKRKSETLDSYNIKSRTNFSCTILHYFDIYLTPAQMQLRNNDNSENKKYNWRSYTDRRLRRRTRYLTNMKLNFRKQSAHHRTARRLHGTYIYSYDIEFLSQVKSYIRAFEWSTIKQTLVWSQAHFVQKHHMDDEAASLTTATRKKKHHLHFKWSLVPNARNSSVSFCYLFYENHNKSLQSDMKTQEVA